ncbi:MAG: HAD family hydrolase [Bacteroidales bacterium]|nr:HAD family hydrolase [Bacteroidales bacterium]MDE6146590.1 HAD family hydrolase [Bacteroidales bacterium]
MEFSHIFFDADDTLWENERFFREAEEHFIKLLSGYTGPEGVQQMLWDRQEENIPLFGYGSKTYMIGMADAAMELCGGRLPSDIYYGIKKIVTDLACHEFSLIDGVEETLGTLQEHYTLVVATKGDVTEQMSKYRRSGLEKYFHHIEVMENKTEKNYLELAAKHDLEPHQLLMVGNSVRSDIVPVINVGGTAINTPHDVVWVHEMMDMPESDRIIVVEKIKDIVNFLL